MERTANVSAIDAIKPTAFYSCESDKIKLNWFLYELAMAYYDDLEKPLKKMFKTKGISEAEIAKLAIYVAQKFKGPICEFADGKIDQIEFQEDFFVDLLPPLSAKNYNRLIDALAKAWDGHLAICETCPTRCISEKDEYCTMFDDDFFNS